MNSTEAPDPLLRRRLVSLVHPNPLPRQTGAIRTTAPPEAPTRPAGGPAPHAGNCSATEGLKEVFPLKVQLALKNGRVAWSWLVQALGDLMDHHQNQGTPLTALMNWDQDGELRSEDLEHLLKRLQAQEVNSQRQKATAQSRR